MPSQPNPIFDSAAFQSAIGRIVAGIFGGDGTLGPLESRSGTFNRVVKFTYGRKRLGVRLALDQTHFRYERDLIKEVFAVSLLNEAGAAIDDERAAARVAALLGAPRGAKLSHPLVRTILHYDWSLTELPYPFFLFEWIEGAVLWEQPFPEHYQAAG